MGNPSRVLPPGSDLSSVPYADLLGTWHVWQLLGFNVSAPTQPAESEEPEWVVTYFASTLFTPAGLDIYSRSKDGLSDAFIEGLIEDIARITVAFAQSAQANDHHSLVHSKRLGASPPASLARSAPRQSSLDLLRDMDNCVNYATTNPDIAGIGVRVSFYLQTFLLVILVDRSWQDAPTALWTFIATSFGLTIATVVQSGAHSGAQLTLFQALQVSNLVWLANFGTFVALASYSRQKAASHKDSEVNIRVGADYNVKFGAMLQTLLSMGLTLYMWSTADTFGSIPECSHLVTYMVFFWKARALGAGKIVGLTASSILTAAYVLITLHELRSYRKSRKNYDEEATMSLAARSPDTTAPSSSTEYSLPKITATAYHKPPVVVPQYPKESASQVPNSSKRRPRRRRWSYEVDPMLIGVMICQILVFGYFIVSTELLLSYNDGAYSSAQQMGFGQILALIVVLPSALSVVGALKEHGLKRLSKRKKTSMRRRNQRANSITGNV
ncbi:hypothetical protein C8R46DRAFT_1217640 [Mycena filopes]|nr:hypothetical protein C8R46DRAFT_1217640 [Mycena filopes]